MSVILSKQMIIPKRTATVTASIDHGTVTGAGTYEIGASCTITAVPSSGYTFVSFTVNGATVTQNPYTFTVTGNTVVTAVTMARRQVSVQITGSGRPGITTFEASYVTRGSTRYSTAATFTAYEGDTLSFTASGTNSTNWAGKVTINGSTVVTARSSFQTYTWTVPAANTVNIVLRAVMNGSNYLGDVTVTTS